MLNYSFFERLYFIREQSELLDCNCISAKFVNQVTEIEV